MSTTAYLLGTLSTLADAGAAEVAAPLAPGAAAAVATQPAATVNGADTAWMLVATALVLLMTPALAFFYGGLARSKNMLNTMMMSFVAMGVITVIWAVIGFSIAFGPGSAIKDGLIVGDFSFLFLKDVGAGVWDPAAALIPAVLFMAFQATFAIITPALISGAVIERMRFVPYVLFIALWSLLVYSPVCHWVWQSNGWLFKKGALDFAGGTVVHINAAVAALVAATVVGRRKDFGKQALIPHNVPFVLLGAGVLWFGWFGFNAGSAVGSGTLAAYAFTNTFLAPAATLVVWAILDLVRTGKITGVGAATGIVVGLVAITPAAGFVSPMNAILLGGIAAFPSYFAIIARAKSGLDDSLDVVAAHGLGGITGAILTGVFADQRINPLATNPVGTQVGIQVIAVLATIIYSGVATFVILKVIGLFTPLKASDKDQATGMDVSQHGEESYHTGEGAILVDPSEVPASSVSVTTPAGAKS